MTEEQFKKKCCEKAGYKIHKNRKDWEDFYNQNTLEILFKAMWTLIQDDEAGEKQEKPCPNCGELAGTYSLGKICNACGCEI